MWKTFKAEFEALWKSRLRFSAWIILLFMPLIYGFLFLSSFWSPFKNTDRLPIVVVDLDKSGSSHNLVTKLVNGGKPLKFTGGSSSYKITVKDAKDIYTTKEQVEKKVNDGTYSAAFVIPANYGKIVTQVELAITNSIVNKNVDVNTLVSSIDGLIKANQGGLIDFYNSFKMSYVAGEMTNMGSSLYRLAGDLLFPDLSLFQPVLDSVKSQIPLITTALAKAQVTGVSDIIAGKLDSTAMSAIGLLANQMSAQIDAVIKNLTPILGINPTLKTELTNIATGLKQLPTAIDATAHQKIIDQLKTSLASFNTAVHNINVSQFLPIINAVKEKVIGDMSKGNLLVDHRTYGKREGVVGEHDILNTYGFGLSPYFLSIVLWAGALLMVFLFPNKRYIKTENTLKNFMGKTGVWVLTGWIQTLLLFAIISIPGIFGSISYDLNGTTVVIKQCINLGSDQGYLILFGLFASTMFMLIVRGIVYTLRVADIGLFICVILLILQLVSSGGTFPVSMQPGFFQFLHKILPFTYTVNAIREIFWDTDPLVVMKDVGILLIIPSIFTTTSFITGYFWDKKTKYKKDGQTRYRSMDKNVGSL